MKPPRTFGNRPHVRYRPELRSCPWCGAALVYSHSVWAKWVQSLDRIEHVTNLGYRCSVPECPGHQAVFRSAQAEARQVKGSTYGLDVIAHIGALRFWPAPHPYRDLATGEHRDCGADLGSSRAEP